MKTPLNSKHFFKKMNSKKTFTFLVMTIIWSWTFWVFGLNYLADGINQESIGTF